VILRDWRAVDWTIRFEATLNLPSALPDERIVAFNGERVSGRIFTMIGRLHILVDKLLLTYLSIKGLGGLVALVQ
jgi:hypothetical protein